METRELRQEFIKTANLFHRMRKNILCEGMSPGELAIMMQLGMAVKQQPEENGVSVSKIAELQKSSMPVVCRILRGMEQKGYIERHQSKQDRRNTQVVFTEYGKETHDKVADKMHAFTDRVMERFGEENTVELISLMKQLAQVVQEETDIEIKKNEEGK